MRLNVEYDHRLIEDQVSKVPVRCVLGMGYTHTNKFNTQ